MIFTERREEGMLSPEEKARRRAIKVSLREAEREKFRAGLPISPLVVRNLFDFVDQSLSDVECDSTLKHTLLFVSQHDLEAMPIITWLERSGGCCDCEVLANVEESFLDAFPKAED